MSSLATSVGLLSCALLLGSAGVARSQEAAADVVPAEPRVDPPSPEAERLVGELRAMKRRLAAREAELDARERAVGELEAEALRLLQQVEALRAALDEQITEWEQENDSRVERSASRGSLDSRRSTPRCRRPRRPPSSRASTSTWRRVC